jgi:citrate synthase
MSETTAKPAFVNGLEGIPAAESGVSSINGQLGKLYYRGYRVEDLAEHCTFEEVAWPAALGKLPNASPSSPASTPS